MNVKIDKELCIGCSLCVSTCTEVFKMQDDKAIVYANPVPEAAQDDCKKAAEECPVTAILFE